MMNTALKSVQQFEKHLSKYFFTPPLSPPYSMAMSTVPGGLSLAEARLHQPKLDTVAQRKAVRANVSIKLVLFI